MSDFKALTHFDLLREALFSRERDYEPLRIQDKALLPYHLLRWFVAWLVTWAWGWWRYLRHRYPGSGRYWAFMWGRLDSPEPVVCPYCLWMGALRQCYHGYQGEDSEAVNCCPRCDGDVL